MHFLNREKILFLLVWIITPYEPFCNLTSLVYKIWLFRMIVRKFKNIWWKNRTHMSPSSPETPVLTFYRLTGHPIPSKVSRVHPPTTWLLVTIGISGIGWAISENIRCKTWLIKTFISPIFYTDEFSFLYGFGRPYEINPNYFE